MGHSRLGGAQSWGIGFHRISGESYYSQFKASRPAAAENHETWEGGMHDPGCTVPCVQMAMNVRMFENLSCSYLYGLSVCVSVGALPLIWLR